MQIQLQPISLDTSDDDADGILVLRDGHLLAVASRLSHHHDAIAGQLFIEAVFGARDGHVGMTFSSEDELVRWAEHVDDIGSRRPAAATRILVRQ